MKQWQFIGEKNNQHHGKGNPFVKTLSLEHLLL